MLDFFRPWQRKIGGLTLMAVLVMGVWLRSLSIKDVLFFPCFGRQHVVFVSCGEITWTGFGAWNR